MGHNEVSKSKFLSLILRHKPESIGIEMSPEGYVDVSLLCKLMPIDKEVLDKIVSEDVKGRYSYSDDGKYIRANQGHSIDVDLGLKEVSSSELPELLYHGTADRFLESILIKGIKPMSRRYVHLSADRQTAYNVGKRHGNPVVLTILARRLYESGVRFWVSTNGVYLTKYVPIFAIELFG
jgi:putative RNA 2'-phosphotransferase